MDKNMSKKVNSVEDGFMDPDDFKAKYETTFSQRWPESKLDEVDEEDRELYSDVDILTGRNKKARTNKFFNNGYNKGKKYNTVNKRLENSFKRFCDELLSRGDEIDFWEKMFKEAKDGDAKFAKMFLEYSIGKPTEHVEVKQDGEITITFEPNENSIERMKENKEE